MCYAAASKNKLKETAKLHQKKYREQTGLFIAEGFKILDEIIEENIKIKEAFCLKEISNRSIDAPVYITDEAGMKKICGTESAPEVITIAEQKKYDIESFQKLDKLILLDSISDAGNLGTIIRSAAAFGVQGIILFGNCTDLYSSKVLRSAAGNFFKVPVISIKSIDELKKFFKNHIKISASLSKENNISFNKCSAVEKRIIMLGSEASGLSAGLERSADFNIRLNMKSSVESLNLAAAASIIFYELSPFKTE